MPSHLAKLICVVAATAPLEAVRVGQSQHAWRPEAFDSGTRAAAPPETVRLGQHSGVDGSPETPASSNDGRAPANSNVKVKTGSCSNFPSEWMIKSGVSCETFKYMHKTRCNAPESVNKDRSHWVANKFCQQTCFDRGNAYDGDNCSSQVRSKAEQSVLTWLGCLRLGGEEESLTGKRAGYFPRTQSCYRACDSHAFMGLHSSGVCFCGDSLRAKPMDWLPDSDCGATCPGEDDLRMPTRLCGSNDRMAVYRRTEVQYKVHTIAKNAYCSDGTDPIYDGTSGGEQDCAARCTQMENCMYYSVWNKSQWCRLTVKCTVRSMDGDNVIMTRRKVLPSHGEEPQALESGRPAYQRDKVRAGEWEVLETGSHHTEVSEGAAEREELSATSKESSQHTERQGLNAISEEVASNKNEQEQHEAASTESKSQQEVPHITATSEERTDNSDEFEDAYEDE